MKPGLPMPVTMIRPFTRWSASSASRKPPSSFSATEAIAFASVASTRRAQASCALAEARWVVRDSRTLPVRGEGEARRIRRVMAIGVYIAYNRGTRATHSNPRGLLP